MTFDWEALDDTEIVVGQPARLVEYVHWHQGLAQIVHQASHAGFTYVRFIQIQIACQSLNQRANRNGMHVRVVVGGLEERQADQCARVTYHGRGNFFDQLAGILGTDGFSHADFPEHGDNRLLGLGANHGRTLQLFAHRCRFERIDSGRNLGMHHSGNRWPGFFLGRGYVEAFGDIDPDLGDAAIADAADVLGVRQSKLAAPEWMFHP